MRDDRELVEAWAAGDARAGSELFERHFPAVHRFFANKVGPEIDDLVQQTFLGCLEARERLASATSFRAYLFGVARNKLVDHCRRGARIRAREEVIGRSLVDMGIEPPDVVAKREEERLLLRALRRLPLELQVALELSYWEGMTDRELAASLAIPEGTLKSRLRHARQLLEAEMASIARSPEHVRSTMGDLSGWAASVRPRADEGE